MKNNNFVLWISIAVMALIIGTGILLHSTYAVSGHYVIFEGVDAHKDEIIKVCPVDDDGKIASSCYNIATSICQSYTKNYMSGSTVNLSGTFSTTSDTTVYCKAGTSNINGYK